VVVSDLLLQGGDNGLEVIAALERHPRGIGPGTARLLVTGETKPDRLREVASAGITVLYKPVSPRVLRQAHPGTAHGRAADGGRGWLR
jgi:CheY-like chemotaxis protein